MGTLYAVSTSGGGGGGAVSSVSNSDGTLTISPTTGAVVASLNLAHANTWTALQTLKITDAVTSAVTNTLVLNHDSSSTPVANFGTGLLFQGMSATVKDRDMANINAVWTTPTDASRATALNLQVLNTSQVLTTVGTFSFPSGASTTSNFLNIIGTLPTVLSANAFGMLFDLTTAGSSSFAIIGLRSNLGAGYTGSSGSIAISAVSTVAGTGSSIIAGSTFANFAFTAQSTGSSATGTNVGAWSNAQNALRNFGSVSIATTAKNSATNVGALVLGLNTGTSPTYVGLYVGASATEGTYTNSVSIFNDFNQSIPIMLAQRNSATFFTLKGYATGTSVTDNFINLTGTLPASISATCYAANFNITTAGSSAFLQGGMNISLLAGYTGAISTAAFSVSNVVAGTANGYAASTSNIAYQVLGNLSISAVASGTTTGSNVALRGLAGGGNTNYGTWTSATVAKNGAINVGIASFALNTGSTPTHCAGFFSLADYATSAPTFANAAIIGDNGGTTDPIFLARNNGTTMMTVLGQITGASNTSNYLNITATLPSVLSSSTRAVLFDFTTAGNSSQAIQGFLVSLGAGYTGASVTVANNSVNTVAGTGTNGATTLSGNVSYSGNTTGTTTGDNTGGRFAASGGNVNHGCVGVAIVNKNAATNIGGIFLANNTGTTPVAVGLYAGLTATTPTYTSAAFIADNGAISAPVALFRANGTTGVQVDASGILGFPNASSGAGAGAGTLTNAPAVGNPHFWVPITVNGTAYWVPAWHT